MTKETQEDRIIRLEAHAASLRLKAHEILQEADAIDRLARRMRQTTPTPTRPLNASM